MQTQTESKVSHDEVNAFAVDAPCINGMTFAEANATLNAMRAKHARAVKRQADFEATRAEFAHLKLARESLRPAPEAPSEDELAARDDGTAEEEYVAMLRGGPQALAEIRKRRAGMPY